MIPRREGSKSYTASPANRGDKVQWAGELQHHARELAARPTEWNYREALAVEVCGSTWLGKGRVRPGESVPDRLVHPRVSAKANALIKTW